MKGKVVNISLYKDLMDLKNIYKDNYYIFGEILNHLNFKNKIDVGRCLEHSGIYIGFYTHTEDSFTPEF